MQFVDQYRQWLGLTIAAICTVLCALVTYIIIRALYKEQHHLSDNGQLSRFDNTAITIDTLMAENKSLAKLTKNVSDAAENQQTTLTNISTKFTRIIDAAIIIEQQYNALTHRLNAVSANLQKLKEATKKADNTVTTIQSDVNNTTQRHNRQKERTQDSYSIMAFLQTKVAELNAQTEHLNTTLSLLDEDTDKHHTNLKTLSHRLENIQLQ